jgi:hypothetical protein
VDAAHGGQKHRFTLGSPRHDRQRWSLLYPVACALRAIRLVVWSGDLYRVADAVAVDTSEEGTLAWTEIGRA